MEYHVNRNRRFRYIKVYRIVKKAHDNTNALSRMFADFINKRSKKVKT